MRYFLIKTNSKLEVWQQGSKTGLLHPINRPPQDHKDEWLWDVSKRVIKEITLQDDPEYFL